jgi:hypothetical protein
VPAWGHLHSRTAGQSERSLVDIRQLTAVQPVVKLTALCDAAPTREPIGTVTKRTRPARALPPHASIVGVDWTQLCLGHALCINLVGITWQVHCGQKRSTEASSTTTSG